jgi:hypothetical protein
MVENMKEMADFPLLFERIKNYLDKPNPSQWERDAAKEACDALIFIIYGGEGIRCNGHPQGRSVSV